LTKTEEEEEVDEGLRADEEAVEDEDEEDEEDEEGEEAALEMGTRQHTQSCLEPTRMIRNRTVENKSRRRTNKTYVT
jgi:hypothetical protein